MVPGGMGAPPGGASWSPMDAWAFAWKVVTTRFTTVALPIAIGSVVQSVVGGIVGGIGTAALTVLQSQGAIDADAIAVLNLAFQGVSTTFGLVIGAFMMGGFVTTALKACRGQPTSFGDVFSGGRYFGRMLVGMIVSFILIAVGMVLCIVPGIIVALGIGLYNMLIVDQDMAGVDAVKKSWEMTKGHKLNIFLFGLIGIGVFLAGVLACGIGAVLVSLPMWWIGITSIYLRIKGENLPTPA
jgi:uncharacterized membrane protein